MTTPVWIGLGSNLGDRRAILDAAVAALSDTSGVAVTSVSPYHETRPVGGPPGQGAFLNAAARLETTLDPRQLLAATQGIEDRAGRVRKVRWGERTLDVDLLIFGCKFLETPELRLPHPRLALRRFVLAPLAEIAPTIVDPMSKRTIADLLANLETPRKRIAIHGPPGPSKSLVLHRLVEGLGAALVSGGEIDHDPAPPADRPGRGFADLLRRLDVLGDEPWLEGPSTPRWVIADYCLGLDLLHPSSLGMALSEGEVELPSRGERMARLRSGAVRARRPTFTVVLPGGAEIRRRPGLTNFPLLWPDSNDPDAIVGEVLATCRSIEGV